MNLNTVDNLRFGSNQVSRAYLGNNLVWDRTGGIDPSLNPAWVFYAEVGDTLDISLITNQATDVEFFVQGYGLESSYQLGNNATTVSHTFQNTGLSYLKFSSDSVTSWDCVKTSKAFGGTLYLSKIPNVSFFQHSGHFTKIIEHQSLEEIYEYKDSLNLQDIIRPEISSWDSNSFDISYNSYAGQIHSKIGVSDSMVDYFVSYNKLSGIIEDLDDSSFNNLKNYWIDNNQISGKAPDVFELGKTRSERDTELAFYNNSFAGVSAKFGFNDNIKIFDISGNSIDRKGLDKILIAANGLYSDLDDVTVSHGNYRITTKFTDILYANNSSDPATGLGSVAYDYSISKYEVTQDQFDIALSSDPNIASGFYAPGTPLFPEKPAVFTFNEAAKYANWLTTGNALEGAYQFSDLNTLVTIDRDYALQQYEVVYVIPNHDEWYKAAYFKPGGWELYTTGSSTPIASVDANYNSSDTWNVGSGSVENNGTYDMAGNLYEWLEEEILRGGAHSTDNNYPQPPNQNEIQLETIKSTGGYIQIGVGGFNYSTLRVAALSLKYDNRTNKVNANPVMGSRIDLRNNDPLGPTGGSSNPDYMNLVSKGWTVYI